VYYPDLELIGAQIGSGQQYLRWVTTVEKERVKALDYIAPAEAEMNYHLEIGQQTEHTST
jgi:NAD dependent epimerase/dehydratase family enzyme